MTDATFASLVDASARLAATSSRKEKSDIVAALLASVPRSEVPAAVGLLVGTPRQGRIGVGWATVSKLDLTPATTATLSIGAVDDLLTELARTSGPGSTQRRADLLTATLTRATEAELDYIRGVFTGGVRHGALEGVVIDGVAKAAEVKVTEVRRATMLGGDLGAAATTALDHGSEGLAAIGLTVLRPIQPMLAATAESPAEAILELGASSVEWKLDGVRVQVHRHGDDVRIFTRNLNDITGRLPEIVASVRALPARSFILDGETISLDSDGRPVPFQETMSAVGTDDPAGRQARVSTYYFDLMHLDGVDLIDDALGRRLEALDTLVGPARMPGDITDRTDTADTVLRAALAAGHEGVMVKSMDSPYQAGRRGKAWRKVKPVHTLDLVVLAAEWGHGRRTGWLSNLHLGARAGDGTFVMVGKTFKGMTDDLLRWQTERFPQIETARDGHTVYVRPEIVVEIALDGAQSSTTYPGGVALRFARVKRYREDKSPTEADTIDAVRALLH